MQRKFKTLYSTREKMFVHFDLSPVTNEVIFSHSDMPMILGHDVEVEDLVKFLGVEVIFPEGTEMRVMNMLLEGSEEELREIYNEPKIEEKKEEILVEEKDQES